MSIFGFYFVTNVLRAAGWPRKQGILRSEVIDTTIGDGAVNQMRTWAASIGAGRPRLALSVLAELFRDKDWTGDDAPNIKLFIERVRAEGDSEPPGVALRLSTFGATITKQQFSDRRIMLGLEQCLVSSLMWGLANPTCFAQWYEASRREHASGMPMARAAGLELGEMPSLEQLFDNSETIIRDYEREVGVLPEIPQRLLADARLVGLRLT